MSVSTSSTVTQDPANQPSPAPSAPASAPAATQTPPVKAEGSDPASGVSIVQPPPAMVTMPQSSLKDIKAKARERGKQQGVEEIARQYGYASVEAFHAAMARVQEAGKPPANPQPQPAATVATVSDADIARYEADKQSWLREKADLERQIAAKDADNSALQANLDAVNTQLALRDEAHKAGIIDVDYAIYLLNKELGKKSEEELTAFDRGAFFAGLKTSHSYLFGVIEKKATTGTGAGAPAAPSPGSTTSTTVAESQVDVRKLNAQEYREHLAKRGIQLPAP